MNVGRELAIGVDIGGTNLKLGAVRPNGELLAHESVPLQKNPDGRADIRALSVHVDRFIQRLPHGCRIAGIGVSCPGLLDTRNRKILHAVNLKWENVALDSFVKPPGGVPVYLEYDALAGALGEKHYGAAQGLPNFLYVCIGTGIGASLFVNGEPYRAGLVSSLNLGHMSIAFDGLSCACGNKGCLEKYVSAPAMRMRLNGKNQSSGDGPDSDLLQLAAQAAASGDLQAAELFRDAGQKLAIGLVNCLQLFGATTVVIGGGVSQAGNLLLDPARDELAARYRYAVSPVGLVQARFPTLAGVMGAAATVFAEEKLI
ncbi:ROK family protein [Cohnella phaseoli]|uniref:Glucokinase n=1 Tax=Cohnella phaseoli TaxID=456490 RepID=A0A3D9JQL5_9BACL|nr:ROK family protein [Cohnella phaseoli]RED75726.1 glucokinase [Cohnella phaseoli]